MERAMAHRPSGPADAEDRQRRVRLPGAAEAQSIFTRLRAAIDRKAADPAANCRAIADREPQEEDII
jgi:hypothetical protein